MVFEGLNELFGNQGLRQLSKIVLIFVALDNLGLGVVQDVMSIKILGVDLLTGRIISGVVLFILFWMIHRNQI